MSYRAAYGFIGMCLVGCATPTTPVVYKFPEAPVEFLKACPALTQVPSGTTQLSEVLMSVTANYSQYHQCQNKVDAWATWYNTQKEISDNVGK